MDNNLVARSTEPVSLRMEGRSLGFLDLLEHPGLKVSGGVWGASSGTPNPQNITSYQGVGRGHRTSVRGRVCLRPIDKIVHGHEDKPLRIRGGEPRHWHGTNLSESGEGNPDTGLGTNLSESGEGNPDTGHVSDLLVAGSGGTLKNLTGTLGEKVSASLWSRPARGWISKS